jgi:hypothetical protein
MLKALFYGAAAAIIGSQLKKMNDQGRLEPYKEQARKGAHQLKERLSEQRQNFMDKRSSRSRGASNGVATTERSAKASSASDLSKPAQPHPWPVDKKAVPSGA